MNIVNNMMILCENDHVKKVYKIFSRCNVKIVFLLREKLQSDVFPEKTRSHVLKICKNLNVLV